MLHTETLKGETHELLNVLMRDERLKSFNLVGGTALALYLGHRISIDLDLFTAGAFDARELEKYLVGEYGFQGDYLEKNTLKGTIADIINKNAVLLWNTVFCKLYYVIDMVVLL